MDQQVCVIKAVAYSLWTDRQTADVTWTDKSLKNEGPMILSIDIFYFKTVIIGGPIHFFISVVKTFYLQFQQTCCDLVRCIFGTFSH